VRSLLHHIIDVLVDDFLRGILKLEDRLDDLEEVIFNNRKTSEEAKKINLLRREVTTLRRIAIPLRSTVSELTSDIQKFSNKDVTFPYVVVMVVCLSAYLCYSITFTS
jgi:magnesium transporter